MNGECPRARFSLSLSFSPCLSQTLHSRNHAHIRAQEQARTQAESAVEGGTIGLSSGIPEKSQVYETRTRTPRHNPSLTFALFAFELWLNSSLATVSVRVFTRFSHTHVHAQEQSQTQTETEAAVEEVGVLETPKSMIIPESTPPSQYTHEWSRLKRSRPWRRRFNRSINSRQQRESDCFHLEAQPCFPSRI